MRLGVEWGRQKKNKLMQVKVSVDHIVVIRCTKESKRLVYSITNRIMNRIRAHILHNL